jgi:hypothetical protein
MVADMRNPAARPAPQPRRMDFPFWPSSCWPMTPWNHDDRRLAEDYLARLGQSGSR